MRTRAFRRHQTSKACPKHRKNAIAIICAIGIVRIATLSTNVVDSFTLKPTTPLKRKNHGLNTETGKLFRLEKENTASPTSNISNCSLIKIFVVPGAKLLTLAGEDGLSITIIKQIKCVAFCVCGAISPSDTQKTIHQL